jgi:hypothetical protein
MKFDFWNNWPTQGKIAFLLAPIPIVSGVAPLFLIPHYVRVYALSADQFPWWTGHGFAVLMAACLAGVLLIAFLSLLEDPGILVQYFCIGMFLFIGLSWGHDALNVWLDTSPPIHIDAKVSSIKEDDRGRYKQVRITFATINDQGHSELFRAVYSKKLFKVNDDKTTVSLSVCEGYFHAPYACSDTQK